MKKHELEILKIEREARKKNRTVSQYLDERRKENKLRYTFVDIGLGLVDKWANRKLSLSIQRKRKKRLKKINALITVLSVSVLVVFLLYPLKEKFFGKKRKKLPRIELSSRQNSKIGAFAEKLLKNYTMHGNEGIKNIWAPGIPPQMKELQVRNLEGFYSIANLRIKNIWKHKKEHNIYYVECLCLNKKAIFRFIEDKQGTLLLASVGS